MRKAHVSQTSQKISEIPRRTHRWKLTKYARKSAENETAKDPQGNIAEAKQGTMLPPPPPVTKAKTKWQHTQVGEIGLEMVITHNHRLLVSHGPTILENISLISSSKTLQAYYQGDALLVIQFIGSPPAERRFRVAFKDELSQTGVEACAESAKQLAKYITVIARQKSVDGSQPETVHAKLEGTVPISSMAEVISSKRSMDLLPLAYQKCELLTQELDTAIRLCLADPNFPKFVKEVEESMNKVMSKK